MGVLSGLKRVVLSRYPVKVQLPKLEGASVDHITPRIGNIVFIGLVAAIAVPAFHAVAAKIKSTSIPVAANIADGYLKITGEAVNQ